MESKVRLSLLSSILTYGLLILFVSGIISSLHEGYKSIILCVILLATVGASLYFYPQRIESSESRLIIHRLFKDMTFDYYDIDSVERCYPSAGGLRLCGSGGFFGYWGYFNDIMIGTYFGCYGDRKQCFLVKLRDGKQYVLSCDQPDEMIETICRHLKK